MTEEERMEYHRMHTSKSYYKHLDKRQQYGREYYRKNKDKAYYNKYPKATEDDWNHYVSCTNCECCNIAFKNDTDKCQDHNHDTGEIRKVLCQLCNKIEGMIRDPEHAEAILNYKRSTIHGCAFPP